MAYEALPCLTAAKAGQLMLSINKNLAKLATFWFREHGHLWTVVWWAHQDSNLEPRDYESPALTVEL